MLKMKRLPEGMLSSIKERSGEYEMGDLNASNWEIRSSGMVVQKRNFDDSSLYSASVSTMKVKVKYGSYCHEININPQASFGELKKLLTERTGLHRDDQKLIFKKKERDPKAYLDVVGVKEGSKMVLVVDTLGRERRLLELHRATTMKKASKSIKEITLEVNYLADKVKSLKSVVLGGGKVLDMEVQNLIELFMTLAIKLERIVADGDLKQERRSQERRVQKYVETLDQLKAKNSQQRRKHSTKPKHIPTTPMPLNSVSTMTPITTSQCHDSKLSWETFE